MIMVRVLVFIAVAVGTAFFVNKISNNNKNNVSREMDEGTLPIVFCDYKGEAVNFMRGYTQSMSTSLMRDGVMPIGDDHDVSVLVLDEDNYGVSYAYELRSVEGDSLIEHGDVPAGTAYNGYVRYTVKFRMDTRMNREYVFVFVIKGESGEEARYYTRVVDVESEYADKVIDYAMDFHETTFQKEYDEKEGNVVSNTLKSTAEGSKDDLSHVNLNSSYDMVSWGNTAPSVITAVIPTITELSTEYVVVMLSYVVTTAEEDEDSGEILHYYHNVKEYYSARYDSSTETVALLAFDRYQESLFESAYVNRMDNTITLGIALPGTIEYAYSDDSKKLAFVKEGQLWYYDYRTSGITSVYDIQQGKYTDIRNQYPQYDINIADIDDEGNIHFVVYGYFSRGEHEGKNGISLYYFDVASSELIEQMFVECDEPYTVMRRDVGRFTYYDSNEGYMYYLLDGSIYRTNLNNMTQDVIMTGISSDRYIVSENRKIVVYPDAEKNEDVRTLTLRNFEDGVEKTISCAEDERLYALGYVQNDLIYGKAKASDIVISSDGEATMPLTSIYINDVDGRVIKEYTKPDMYVMDVNVTDENIYLTRATKSGQYFKECDEDYISYKKDSSSELLEIEGVNDRLYGASLAITFPSGMYLSSDLSSIRTKNRVSDAYKELKVTTNPDSQLYYVYDNSGYAGAYRSAGNAILAVEKLSAGIVTDGRGDTIYRRLEAVTYNTVADYIKETACENMEDSLITCAYMCIERINSKAVLEDIMKEEGWENAFYNHSEGVGINISGINLATALYFLDRDVPFAARIADGRYVLVISYNSTHIRYYDPIRDEEVKVTRESFESSLNKQGNTMYTYIFQ